MKMVIVNEIKYCDFCKSNEEDVEAKFDGKTQFGPWANMCKDHFDQYGIGLGLGKGQALIYKAEGDNKNGK